MRRRLTSWKNDGREGRTDQTDDLSYHASLKEPSTTPRARLGEDVQQQEKLGFLQARAVMAKLPNQCQWPGFWTSLLVLLHALTRPGLDATDYCNSLSLNGKLERIIRSAYQKQVSN